jgi:hypothetical protein
MNNFHTHHSIMEGVCVSITFAKQAPLLHIRQVKLESGITMVNNEGVHISAGDFAAVMRQLKYIEQSQIFTPTLSSIDEIAPPQLLPKEAAPAAVAVAPPKRKRKRAPDSPPATTVTLQAMTIAFAEVLLLHIRNLVTEKCFGCLMGFTDNHELCNDSSTYVPQYFDAAMSLMTQVEIENYVNEKRVTTPALTMESCPLKAHYLVKPRRKQLIDVILSLC